MPEGIFIGERMGRWVAGGSVNVSVLMAGGEKPLLLPGVERRSTPTRSRKLPSNLLHPSGTPALQHAFENGLKLGQECRMIYIGCSSQALARAAWS
jgi:hypothetical protein